MAFNYRVTKKKNGINNKQYYYAVPARPGKITTRLIAKQIADRSSLTKADVYAALSSLAEVMQTFLQMGHTIKLDNLGTFSLSITSDGHPTAEEVTPHLVRAKRICFIADTSVKDELKHIKFERKKE